MSDRSQSSEAGFVNISDRSENESDTVMNGQHPSSASGRQGTNITVAINDFTSENLVINLGHPQVKTTFHPYDCTGRCSQKIGSHPIHCSNNTCNKAVTIQAAPRSGMELNNSKRTKLVISEAFPVPTAKLGTADIVGFGTTGVAFVRNSVNIQKREATPCFGYDAGWRVEKHVRLVADTTGSKHGDLVGFGEMGVWISRNNGDNTFQTPKMAVPNFSYAAGWRVEKHPRFMADIRNLGRSRLVTTSFGYNSSGWRLEKHLRFLVDTNGNGFLDIVGFGESQVEVAYNNGDGTFQPSIPILEGICYSNTWRVGHHPRLFADLTGNGKPDLIGFSHWGVEVAFNNGDGTFLTKQPVSEYFGVGSGWNFEKHPRFIADLTGNGCGDIIGFGDEGVYVAINNGDATFQPMKLALTAFGYNGGWRVKQNPRFLVDMTGDGRADILGFGNEGVYVSYNDGKGNFTEPKMLIQDFGCDAGWVAEKTERYVANIFHS